MLWRVEGDFTAGKLTPTDFDFLHAGLALSSMSRVMFVTLNGGTCRGCNCSFSEMVKSAQVVNFPATWVTDPIRMLHGSPTSLQISANTNPKHSYHFDDLRRFSEEDWPRFPRLLAKLTLNEILHNLH